MSILSSILQSLRNGLSAIRELAISYPLGSAIFVTSMVLLAISLLPRDGGDGN